MEQNILQQLWEVALAVIGGIAAFMRRLLNDELRQHWLIELVANTFIAGFAGLMTMYLGSSMGLGMNALSVMVGISGWLGVKALDSLAAWYETKLGARP